MKPLLLFATIGLFAAPAIAAPELLPIRGIRHATYDPATGALTPPAGSQRMGDSVWAATRRPGYYYAQMQNGPGATTMDWGDIDGPLHIGGFTFSYTTDVILPETLDVVIRFYAEENGYNSADRVLLTAFRMENLPTADPDGLFNTWALTVNLDQADLAFTLDGSDLDRDNLTDFGYTYWFTNLPPTARNYTGPAIAGDPNTGTSPGIEDVFGAFGDPNLHDYQGSRWGSGYPYLQFYMELFDSNDAQFWGWCPNPGISGGWCTADVYPSDSDGHWDYHVDGDCQVGLADLATLLAHYGVNDCATHEQGDVTPCAGRYWLDGRDGDHRVNLADVAALLSQYGDVCN